jgi:hypothetical protein
MEAPIKQLGNAVPVQVGQAFGSAIRAVLERALRNPPHANGSNTLIP